MSRSHRFWLALAVVVASPVFARAEPLILCGAERVFLVEVEATSEPQEKPKRLWTWQAKTCSQLPEKLRGTFASTDDCKPVDGGKKILISSSSSGCVLVERATGDALWYAQVANAHSVELLPGNRIAVAGSDAPQGNRLVLFDIAKPNQPIWETPLPSGHGVVWDEGRRLLWALGGPELRSYALKDWDTPKPSLALKGTHRLPTMGGHDLQPIPKSNDLVLTSGGVYLFDREKLAFRLHPEIGKLVPVKSVNVHPTTGRVAYIRATTSWWSDTVVFLSPPGKMQLAGERLYKARWLATPN